MNYYNENDKKTAAWLRELINSGCIPVGEVDERSIVDVQPADIAGFVQCHFFAGIGGWPYALKLARWPVDRPVWTGSCPCQPFSCAGKQQGIADSRHLWPEFKRLIESAKPSTVFGEQVASKAGRLWLAGVFADLEGMGYRRAGADLCAAGVGAPHIRQRLFWMGDPIQQGLEKQPSIPGISRETGETISRKAAFRAGPSILRLDHPNQPTQERFRPVGLPLESEQETGRCSNANPWQDFQTIGCADGKTRRVKSGLLCLANGIPGRVGLLRGYGNAIVPQVAAEFIQAYLECA